MASGAKAGTRSAARRRALDVLYEADLLGQPIEVVLARQLERPGPDVGPLDAYATELVRGVDRHLDQIDQRISAAAEHWTIPRMPLVDRNVLRLGTYELLDQADVPTPVVLNEAVELAKLLSTADSGRFVNGVLAAIARTVRDQEERPADTGGQET
jgi:transcription antitermination protein NusB